MATHRQYPTHDQEYLREVAAEGFALVDKFYGRGTTRICPPPSPPLAAPASQLYDDRAQQAVNSKQVAYRSGGTMRKPAQIFGGTLIPARRWDV
ncbi:hypothetical protein Ddye_020681 [Dipteronia dyeriana]|uniref:Uncharacterized protein n=1 Tax=Dipteronia dyeriana TaxID=168575 RepID=A0AAD9U0Z8_9ROSI|nr:hypothetical protein Ddye_020681 [Dipteronia dyeriana]